MYCEECGKDIKEPNEQGDFICKDCEVYCTICGEYCYQESNEGMCEDCYEDYLEDYLEDCLEDYLEDIEEDIEEDED